MGYMKWCCFWNTVYDGTIASGVHMLISTFVYIGMCMALLSFASYYGGESSTPMAAGHRQHRLAQQRSYYQSLSQMTGDSAAPHDPSAAGENVDKEGKPGEDLQRPLLSEWERDLYIYSSLFMIGFNVPILITSLLLIIGAYLRKPRVMFVWVVSMVPYLVIDTIYHSFLFYTLLAFEDLDALQTYLWFQLWTVMIIMFWVFRCAFDVYAILCVMSFRHEILRSGKSKVKNITNNNPNNEPVSAKNSNNPAALAGSTFAALAKTGLQTTQLLTGGDSAFQIDELELHQKQLDALHNAAATADVQHQLLLMSAAQHLAAASGLLAPTAAIGPDPNLMSHVDPATNCYNPHQNQPQQFGANNMAPPRTTSTGTLIGVPPGPGQLPSMTGDFLSQMHPINQPVPTVGAPMVQGLPPLPPGQMSHQPTGGFGAIAASLTNLPGVGAMGPRPPGMPGGQRRVAGWGMSKYLLKQQQQALAIATGLHKSGVLPPSTPLLALAQAAQQHPMFANGHINLNRMNSNMLQVPNGKSNAPSAGSNNPNNTAQTPISPTTRNGMLVDVLLSSQSKRYAKQWLKINRQQGDEDFSAQTLIDAA